MTQRITTFVALLRGVNVGSARRVPMESLRKLLAGLGYADARTLLNSGNAVFRAPAGPSAAVHAEAVARAIARDLGIEVPVVVKSARELAAIVEENPFARAAPDPSRLLVAFAQDAHGLHALAGIAALVAPPEGFVIGAHAAYLHCATGILASKAGEAILAQRGQASTTTRNWATVMKLQALASAVDACRPAASGGA